MDLKKLDEPFASSDIEWRAQSCGKGNNGFWVSVLAYVTNRAIMSRLDEVCGKENWRNEYRDVGKDGKVVECGISIKIGGEWVTKWDAAEETSIEAVKGGRSGAMKRAAVQWGIGRYLYNLDAGWGQIVERGEHRAKTKQGEFFQWNPPQLPDWALPPRKPDQKALENSAGILKSFVVMVESCTTTQALSQQKDRFFGNPQNKGMTEEDKSKAESAYKAHMQQLESMGG